MTVPRVRRKGGGGEFAVALRLDGWVQEAMCAISGRRQPLSLD
jgi:hypothetical protein